MIDHSREWSADAGAVIARCDSTGTSTDGDDWILFDGDWHIEHGNRHYVSGHADPGKWFNTREADGEPRALTATEHSYVMRITVAGMQQMIDKGFAFDRHLDEGRAFTARSLLPPRRPTDMLRPLLPKSLWITTNKRLADMLTDAIIARKNGVHRLAFRNVADYLH